MTETTQQYKARLDSYVEGKDPIAMQLEAPSVIARLIEGIGDEKLKKQPVRGKWSITAILMHLVEDELASSWRYRQMLEHDTPELAGYDQDLWARIGDYSSCDAQDALGLFRLLREANLRMFAQLTPAQWQRSGVHSERGRLTVRDLCRHMAAHDINHIEQIRRILSCDGYHRKFLSNLACIS
jgi:uncharacterized damage-inducible protein DinB